MSENQTAIAMQPRQRARRGRPPKGDRVDELLRSLHEMNRLLNGVGALATESGYLPAAMLQASMALDLKLRKSQAEVDVCTEVQKHLVPVVELAMNIAQRCHEAADAVQPRTFAEIAASIAREGIVSES